MAGDVGDRSLKETPTWAVALVCFVMIILSVLMEHGIHTLGHWFKKRNKKAMNEALEKIKAELMLLGFISLLLTVGQDPISKICIPAKAGSIMLPCKPPDKPTVKKEVGHCSKHKDTVPLISQTGIHQLHIFIFVLAVFHVLYSVLTMVLGQAKMRKWKAWEAETTSLEYQFINDPSRFRLTNQTSFVKRHVGLSSTPGIRWIVAFFRQFFASVTKVDYLTMRHGFINAHLSPNTKFNFHKYLKRSLEDDFKVVVGISFPLWTMAMIIMLLDVYGWYTLVWVSFVPLIVLLMVGTKLEMIIMEMAHQIQNKTTVVKGAPVVEPSNSYFWFNNPEWVLFLVQLTLFQNAFQIANFLWIWYSFSLRSCFHDNFVLTIFKLVMGIGLQFLCSYITFPLYALVTQMGSHMKKAIFEEHTAKAILKWREAARDRRKHKGTNRGSQDFASGYLSGESTPQGGSSPVYLLKNFKSSSNDVESVGGNSPRFSPSDAEMSDMEAPTFKWRGEFEPRRSNTQIKEEKFENVGDFSFGSK